MPEVINNVKVNIAVLVHLLANVSARLSDVKHVKVSKVPNHSLNFWIWGLKFGGSNACVNQSQDQTFRHILTHKCNLTVTLALAWGSTKKILFTTLSPLRCCATWMICSRETSSRQLLIQAGPTALTQACLSSGRPYRPTRSLWMLPYSTEALTVTGSQI